MMMLLIADVWVSKLVLDFSCNAPDSELSREYRTRERDIVHLYLLLSVHGLFVPVVLEVGRVVGCWEAVPYGSSRSEVKENNGERSSRRQVDTWT
jgi:hypothetical protein